MNRAEKEAYLRDYEVATKKGKPFFPYAVMKDTAMMLIVALFVIVNTIRIAVHARRDEIEIMKLVGATDWFVRWPFILEGILVGALGALATIVSRRAASGIWRTLTGEEPPTKK